MKLQKQADGRRWLRGTFSFRHGKVAILPALAPFEGQRGYHGDLARFPAFYFREWERIPWLLVGAIALKGAPERMTPVVVVGA